MNLNEKPLWQLTANEFLLLAKNLLQEQSLTENPNIDVDKETKYVYGISGIANHLNISKSKVDRIKKSLEPAIIQNGRSIMADADLLLKLYNENEEYKKKA